MLPRLKEFKNPLYFEEKQKPADYTEAEKTFITLTKSNSYNKSDITQAIQEVKEDDQIKIYKSLSALKRLGLMDRDTQAAVIAAGPQHASAMVDALKILLDANIILSKDIYLALVRAGNQAKELANLLDELKRYIPTEGMDKKEITEALLTLVHAGVPLSAEIKTLLGNTFFYGLHERLHVVVEKLIELNNAKVPLIQLTLDVVSCAYAVHDVEASSILRHSDGILTDELIKLIKPCVVNKEKIVDFTKNLVRLHEAGIPFTEEMISIINIDQKDQVENAVIIIRLLHRQNMLGQKILHRIKMDCLCEKDAETMRKSYKALILLKQSYGDSLEDIVFNQILYYNDKLIQLIVRAFLRLKDNKILSFTNEVQIALIQSGSQILDIVDALVELKSCGILLEDTFVIDLARRRLFIKYTSLNKSNIIDVLILCNNEIDVAEKVLEQLNKKSKKDIDIILDELLKLYENDIEISETILCEYDVNVIIHFVDFLISLKINFGFFLGKKRMHDILFMNSMNEAFSIVKALCSLHVHEVLLDPVAQHEIVLCGVRAQKIASLLIQLNFYKVPCTKELIYYLRDYDIGLLAKRNSHRSVSNWKLSGCFEDYNNDDLLKNSDFLCAIASLCSAQIPLTMATFQCLSDLNNRKYGYDAIHIASGFMLLKQGGTSADMDGTITAMCSEFPHGDEEGNINSFIGNYIINLINNQNKEVKDYLMTFQQDFFLTPLWHLIISYFNEIQNMMIQTAYFSETLNDEAEEKAVPLCVSYSTILSPPKIYLKRNHCIFFSVGKKVEGVEQIIEVKNKPSIDQNEKRETRSNTL